MMGYGTRKSGSGYGNQARKGLKLRRTIRKKIIKADYAIDSARDMTRKSKKLSEVREHLENAHAEANKAFNASYES